MVIYIYKIVIWKKISLYMEIIDNKSILKIFLYFVLVIVELI